MSLPYSPQVNELIDAFKRLPGIGPKTAQRLAFHLLQSDRQSGMRLSKALQIAMETVKHCEHCRNFSEKAICTLCERTSRDAERLCVVESPADVVAIEETHAFKGYYFVLLGRLSPLDGIGPDALGLDTLQARLETGDIRELILATGTTVEGEATAYYIAEIAKSAGVRTTRIAYGVPVGGELEHLDGNTLGRALAARAEV